MNVAFIETAPCANFYDVLAVQACKQVRLANDITELANAIQQHFEIMNSESIDRAKGYGLVIGIPYSLELWKRNEKGEYTCKLLEMWLQRTSSRIPENIIIHKGNLNA